MHCNDHSPFLVKPFTTDVTGVRFLNNVNLQNRLMTRGLRRAGVCLSWVARGLKLLMRVQPLSGIKAPVFLLNLGTRVLAALSPTSGIKAVFTKPFSHGNDTNLNRVKVDRSTAVKTHKTQ